MPPKKRRQDQQRPSSSQSTQKKVKKHLSKTEIEKLICKKKLDALEQEESQIKEDRFSSEEKSRLLDAYNESGFQIFQDMKLLHKYLPNRKESDLKGLVQRLKTSLLARKESKPATQDDQKLISGSHNENWQRLCQQMLGNHARDSKINLNDIYAEVLLLEAERMQFENQSRNSAQQDNDSTSDDPNKPNYPKLMNSFAQLLMGKFPDNMTKANSRISVKLYDHLNSIIDSIDLDPIAKSIADGNWLNTTVEERHAVQQMALGGLSEIDGVTKKCPSFKDIERNRNIEALCLELPKIKRITEVLNPLKLNESQVSSLITKLV